MCAGRRARTPWLRWKPHMLFGWTNKDHMTYTRRDKERLGAISLKIPHEKKSSLCALKWTRIRMKIAFTLCGSNITFENFKGKPPAVLFLSLCSSRPRIVASRPKRLTFPISPKLFWSLWLRTAFYREIVSNDSCELELDFYADNTLVSAGRMEAFFIQTV